MAESASDILDSIIHVKLEPHGAQIPQKQKSMLESQMQPDQYSHPSEKSSDASTEQPQGQGFSLGHRDATPNHQYLLQPSFIEPSPAHSIQESVYEIPSLVNSHTNEIPAPECSLEESVLRKRLEYLEAYIREWTPFLLVGSYFIFSTCLYMLCNGELISIFWFIYLTTNFYIAGSTVIEAVMSMSPLRDGKHALQKLQENNWTFPTYEYQLPIIDLVTVAYLPNEKVRWHSITEMFLTHIILRIS
jgi:hypothetical protein